MKVINPCINCITFAICNAKIKSSIKHIKGTTVKDHQLSMAFNDVIVMCVLLTDYLIQTYYMNFKLMQHQKDYVLSKFIRKEIIEVFNIDVNKEYT